MVARGLKEGGLRVFYDEDEKVKVWGKDLAEHFDHIYRTASRSCDVRISGVCGEAVDPPRAAQRTRSCSGRGG